MYPLEKYFFKYLNPITTTPVTKYMNKTISWGQDCVILPSL